LLAEVEQGEQVTPVGDQLTQRRAAALASGVGLAAETAP
jgi:hypothetical protein